MYTAGPQSNGVCYYCCVYQHSTNNRWIFITGLSQSNYENEYIRNAAICLLVRIAQLVEHPVKTDQLTFIKRHRAFESRKLLLLFSFLFIYNSFLYFFHVFYHSLFFFLLYVYFIFCNSFYQYIQYIYTNYLRMIHFDDYGIKAWYTYI